MAPFIGTGVSIGSGVLMSAAASAIAPPVASPQLWIFGDLGLTQSAGNLVSIVGQGSTANTYAPTGNAPAISTVNGHSVIVFDNANAERMSSNGTAANYTWIHNSTVGSTLYWTLTPAVGAGVSAGVFFDTNGGPSTGRIGMGLRLDTRPSFQRAVIVIGNGSAYYVSANSGVGSLPQGETHVLCFRHKAGETNEYEFFVDGVSAASGAYLTTGSTSAPNYPLRFGDNVTATYPDMTLHETVGYTGYHDNTTVLAASTTLLGRWS